MISSRELVKAVGIGLAGGALVITGLHFLGERGGDFASEVARRAARGDANAIATKCVIDTAEEVRLRQANSITGELSVDQREGLLSQFTECLNMVRR